MEALLANIYILVPLILLPLSLYLVSFMPLLGSRKKNLPPGSRGWPILGENLRMFSLGPEKFMKERMAKYSAEAFQTSLFGQKVAVLCGVQGNKFQFTNENKKTFCRWVPHSLRKVLYFPENEKISMQEITPILRQSFNQAILKPESLKQHIPVMDAMARTHIDQYWEKKETVKVLPLSKKYTFELACKLLLNVVDKERIKRLADPFYIMADSLMSVPINLPGTGYRRAIRCGKMVRGEMMELIKERRKQLNDGENSKDMCMLSKMMLVKNEDREFLSDEVISDNVVGMLFASFDTTSSSIASIMNFLAKLSHIYEQVYKEQMEIKNSKGPDELLTWEDIEKMKYTWNVMRESLRLLPPAQGSFREALTDFTYAGYTIPKGFKTFWSVHTSHKNPDYFPEPDKFDPSRFEGKGPAPYTFIPFGGGSTICPGRDYARLEVLVLIHNVVTRFKLQKAIPNEKIVYYASSTPVHGLPVNLRPHKLN